MMRTNARPDQGVIVIAVLVCLLIASAMAATITRSALQSRREVKRDHQLRQAELLLDAGVLRSAQRVRQDPQYDGETWQLDDALPAFDHARLEISIARPDNQDAQVTVTAILGQPGGQRLVASSGSTQRDAADGQRVIRRTTFFTISNPSPSVTNSSNNAE